MTLERDLVSGAKAGRSGLMRMPGAQPRPRNAAVSAGHRAGCAQMISFRHRFRIGADAPSFCCEDDCSSARCRHSEHRLIRELGLA